MSERSSGVRGRWACASVAVVVGLVTASTAWADPLSAPGLRDVLRSGDLVLQQSTSHQAAAIAEASGSPWTHVGIVFERDGDLEVLEAIGPVQWTPLDAWVARGVDDAVVAVRVGGADGLDVATVAAVRAAGEAMLGRRYDTVFEWSDDRVYCSELTFKAFERGAGLEVGALVTFADLALDGPAARALIEARLDADPDGAEPIVTPGSVLDDADVVVVWPVEPEVANDGIDD